MAPDPSRHGSRAHWLQCLRHFRWQSALSEIDLLMLIWQFAIAKKHIFSTSIIRDWGMFIACWARWSMVNPDKLSCLLSSNFYSNAVVFPKYLLPGARQGQTQLTANDASFHISILCIYYVYIMYVYIYIHVYIYTVIYIYIYSNIVPSPNPHIP